MIQNWKFQRGDIFFTRFDNAIGSEQSGNRPAVVLQNDVGNFYSPTLIVATLTSKAAKKYTQPTHCLLVNDFLSVPSIVQAEQIFTVDKSRVLKFLGHLTPEEMSRVDDAVRASLALNPMGSMHFVELYHGEFSEERLLRALRSIHPVDIYRIGQDDPAKLRGWKKYVFPIYTAYNGKCRKDALPMKF